MVGDGAIQVIEHVSADRRCHPPKPHPVARARVRDRGALEFLIGTAHGYRPGRTPCSSSRRLVVTIGPPCDGFTRDIAALYAGESISIEEVVAVAARHGVKPG